MQWLVSTHTIKKLLVKSEKILVEICHIPHEHCQGFHERFGFSVWDIFWLCLVTEIHLPNEEMQLILLKLFFNHTGISLELENETQYTHFGLFRASRHVNKQLHTTYQGHGTKEIFLN